MDWNRRSTRLRGWSYVWPGDYFITIRTRQPGPSLGEVRGARVLLSPGGLIVRSIWCGLPERFNGARVDCFQIMPDHLHGVISIGLWFDPCRLSAGAPGFDYLRGPPSVGRIVRAFKAATTRHIRQKVCSEFGWQRGYYDRVIRDGRELNRIRRYVATNPLRWK